MKILFIIVGALALAALAFGIWLIFALARCGKAQDESRDDA